MRNPVPRLYQLFSHEDRLLILIDPDPDSIASALALKRLLWHRLSACVISPIRPITRPQNQRLVKLLGITLNPIEKIHPEDFPRKALVDSQPGHHEIFASFLFDAVIDHHPRLPDTRGRFVDIRAEYGATSTIMTEYLREARIRPSLKLATALYYGIKTDTANFERPVGGSRYARLSLSLRVHPPASGAAPGVCRIQSPHAALFPIGPEPLLHPAQPHLCLLGGGCRPGHPGHSGGLLRAGRGDLLDHRGGHLRRPAGGDLPQ